MDLLSLHEEHLSKVQYFPRINRKIISDKRQQLSICDRAVYQERTFLIIDSHYLRIVLYEGHNSRNRCSLHERRTDVNNQSKFSIPPPIEHVRQVIPCKCLFDEARSASEVPMAMKKDEEEK